MSFQYDNTMEATYTSANTIDGLSMPMFKDMGMPPRLDQRRASVEEVDDCDECLNHNVGGEDVIADSAAWAKMEATATMED